MLRLVGHKAQSVIEYGLLIAIVTIGLGAMNIYVKRAAQGAYKQGFDALGNQRAYVDSKTKRITNTTDNFEENSSVIVLYNFLSPNHILISKDEVSYANHTENATQRTKLYEQDTDE